MTCRGKSVLCFNYIISGMSTSSSEAFAKHSSNAKNYCITIWKENNPRGSSNNNSTRLYKSAIKWLTLLYAFRLYLYYCFVLTRFDLKFISQMQWNFLKTKWKKKAQKAHLRLKIWVLIYEMRFRLDAHVCNWRQSLDLLIILKM